MGRPSAYRAEYAAQAEKLCRLGATDKELGDFFGVSEQTINAWKQQFPEFLESLKSGKAKADAEVANSLYRRAVGYSHDAVKIVADAKSGTEHIVPYTEHYPPDTVACIFWLKNRRPEQWRDKTEQVVNVTRRTVVEYTDDELAAVIRGSGAGTAKAQAGPQEPPSVH